MDEGKTFELENMISQLEHSVSALEGKMDELYMRPRMPYSQGASSGDILELDADLKPQWVP